MKTGSRALVSALFVVCIAAAQATYAQAPQPTGILFGNVRIFNGTSDRLSALAKEYKISTAWGTDFLYSAETAAGQGKILTGRSTRTR